MKKSFCFGNAYAVAVALTSSCISQHNQLIDARDHLLYQVRAFLHNNLAILVECVRIQFDTAQMRVQNSTCFHRIHPTQRHFLALFIQIRQLTNQLKWKNLRKISGLKMHSAMKSLWLV